MKQDLRDRKDVEVLVTQFYSTLLLDEEMQKIFFEVATLDLEKHKPILCDFWESLLFGTGGYGRNAMKVHLDLHFRYPLTPDHFKFWLKTFNQTVDKLFHGPKAKEAKEKASSIASLIQMKISQKIM